MSESSPPTELLRDALARIAADGALVDATPAMAKWLSPRGITHVDALPLDDDGRRRFAAGEPVPVDDAAGTFELEPVPHGAERWLRLVEHAGCDRCRAVRRAAGRARLLASLAGSIAHDLNNHLHAAVGLSAVLSPYARDDADRVALQELERAVRAGSRIVETVARMLRRTPSRTDTADAQAMLDDVLALVRKQLSVASVPCEVVTRPDLPPLAMAHDDAVQVVLAGVTALLDASPNAVRVELCEAPPAAVGDRGRRVLELTWSAARVDAAVAADLERAAVAGPGLLLAVVRKPALQALTAAVATQRRHGGDLVVERRGDGLRLRWTWPIAASRRVR